MSGFEGMDTAAVREAGAMFNAVAADIADATAKINSVLNALLWPGLDAEMVRKEFATVIAPSLHAACTFLEDTAARMTQNAHAQEQISAA